MSYEWENAFETEFKTLLKIKDNTEMKIIIGQAPYKEQLNGIDFKVNSSKGPYDKLGYTVAFFVTKWIKIQDSLEMVFNLLFNNKSNSANAINVLNYLRKNNISSDEFADYLYKEYSIVITNITNKYKNDNVSKIIDLINDIKKPTYLLLVGNEAKNEVNNIRSNYIKGYIDFIHPSGRNLSVKNRQSRYYENWYRLRNISGNKQNIIDKFILFI